mmetsp:Transcript_28132/g.90890  ORF Transcript_28132/g.90890 Transcript_28132/m.90890 type:complete len:252 (-) Transcript_28132:73-828(-)
MCRCTQLPHLAGSQQRIVAGRWRPSRYLGDLRGCARVSGGGRFVQDSWLRWHVDPVARPGGGAADCASVARSRHCHRHPCPVGQVAVAAVRPRHLAGRRLHFPLFLGPPRLADRPPRPSNVGCVKPCLGCQRGQRGPEHGAVTATAAPRGGCRQPDIAAISAIAVVLAASCQAHPQRSRCRLKTVAPDGGARAQAPSPDRFGGCCCLAYHVAARHVAERVHCALSAAATPLILCLFHQLRMGSLPYRGICI